MLHLKNAILFHDEFWDNDSIQFAIEQHVLEEMEQLSTNESVTPVEFVLTLDKMIGEIDEILKAE